MSVSAVIQHAVERLRLSRMLLTLCLAVMSSALMGGTSCLATSLPSRIPCGMCEEQDRFVRLQSRPVGTASQAHTVNYSHPARFAPEELARVLGRIRVQSRSEGLFFGSTKGPIIDAFTPEDIRFLNVALMKAFAEARQDEIVVFGLARPRAPALTEITTGSWFVKEGELHLVLINYRTAVTLPGIRRLLWDEPLRKQTGLQYELVPGDAQTPVQNPDEEASLFGSQHSSQIAIQYRMIAQPDHPSDASSSDSTLLPEPSRTLEDRLERLKRLWGQGLITEDEYRLKRKELIDRF